MSFPFEPPLEPMLAAVADGIPTGDWIYEPKWDGFRALVFRDGDEVYLQSRDLKPLDRYFPELLDPLRASLPRRCVLDGEIVIAGRHGLEFESLLQRIHPAASRVEKLSRETPASFVAFDLLATGDRDLRGTPFAERRAALESALGKAKPPILLTPATRDAATAQDWFQRFEGAGLDGVMAKSPDGTYEPGRRTMIKVKHARTADCVVGGFRWHKEGPGIQVGSILLGLYDDGGTLHHVGIASGWSRVRRVELAAELGPLREGANIDHPWTDGDPESQRLPGATSRWNAGKNLNWEPVRIERAVEVAYDHLQGTRFRHATRFVRWRPDKPPADCRYDQLEVTPAYELSSIFGS
jgi:ATP-dependent DNA ligase